MENIKLDNGYELTFERELDNEEGYELTGYILKDGELLDNFSGIGLYGSYEDVEIALMKYLIEVEKVEITKDNIHLYYEFMDDKDSEKFDNILNNNFFANRSTEVMRCLNFGIIENWNNYQFFYSKENFCIGFEAFGVKDTLMPIDEYINKIKSSDTFINFEKEKSLKQLN